MNHRITALVLSLLFIRAGAVHIRAEIDTPAAAVDSDSDGLSDALEQRLLEQFAPSFLMGAEDCAGAPAEFAINQVRPLVAERNGTIYGQVSPFRGSVDSHAMVEIHFYHLWATDCGKHGHPLDSEHVSVLVRASNADLETARWKAAYWYAAAHENTVCDVSQIARASTLGGEDGGVKVWISPGKHASYFNSELCHAGCGADRCEGMTPLKTTRPINLGEAGAPMDGARFVTSPLWPLMAKMTSTNFSAESLSRLEGLPDSNIAWANPGRHPAQGIIADSSAVSDALAVSGQNTTGAVSQAGDSTGNALGKGYANTKHALGSSARAVGRALGMKDSKPKADAPKQ